MQEGSETADHAEVRQDLDRYAQLIMRSGKAWVDFWAVSGAFMVGGVCVFLFSGETWAIACGIFVFAGLFMRTARIIGRLDGELLFLHRKWIRRGWFFTSDGHSAEALPHNPPSFSDR
ncbi:MAG: hypothetical protein AAGK37_00485 [Pseudomonadota bacterium]